jgi:vibriolysin
MTLVSRVHYSVNYNNAFWDGSQMTYGDGDGVTFIPLSQDADVVAHELTHGVTERSSNLVYSNESGALNEALSDIFGALVDRQEGATGADIWLLGEDIYTPATPGDGLRVMNDPAAAGDYDWYPTRYTGTSDNGGVHWNSGIANLAFVLLVEGGTHPRGKSSVVVPGIGFSAAADIFYAANTACLTSSSNFKAMRYCTADNAGANAAAVHLAWDAVGVPVNTLPIVLTDGTPLSGQSGSTGDEQQYTLDVAAGASTLTFTTAGNNGDADLYVRFGAEATTATYDCNSISSTSNESCSFNNPSAGTWYAMVHAWSSYSNLTVTGTTGGGGGCFPLGASCTANSQCCSNRCKGKAGSEICK